MGDFTQVLSEGCSQDLGWCCSHLKAGLGLQDTLPNWFSHLSVIRMSQYLQHGPLHWADLSVLSTWQLASSWLSDSRESKIEALMFSYYLILEAIHFHFFKIMEVTQFICIHRGRGIYQSMNTKRWSIIEDISKTGYSHPLCLK